MEKLEPPDSFHVEAAEGWIGLGDLNSASNELDAMSPVLRAHPTVLLVRCDIYFAAKKWVELVSVAEPLVQAVPEERQAWIHRSFGLHALGRTQDAFDALLPAADRFPKFWLVPYNLACYCAQLGRIKESENWFKMAMALNEKEVQRHGIEDPDLEPLWTGVKGTSWKRIG